MRRRVVLVLLCALLASCARAARGAAQQTESTGAPMKPEEVPDATTYRLRTFVNRIQVPTFVLGSNRMPVPDLPASAFSIRLDSGPAFHPTLARVEGNDPISLGVLIDAAGSQPQLVAQLANALSSLAPDILLQTDSVSIFGADCKMYRTRFNKPYDPTFVHAAVLQALEAVRPPGGVRRQSCESSFRLLDFASYMFMQMKDLPGRRVALIVSGGHDSKSKMKLAELSRLGARVAISVFGLREAAERTRSPQADLNPFASGATYGEQEDKFELLCASNGGAIFEPIDGDIVAELLRMVYLLRTRYILEFPAPDRGNSGTHSLEVFLKDKNKFLVRSTGASAVLPESGSASDPSIIPTQASPAVFGSRRPVGGTKY